MLVVVASAKHSPGVTTLALTLVAAAARRSDSALLIEADANGGDLAARLGMRVEPGLVSLAAAARRTCDEELLDSHSQHLPGTAATVIVAPPAPDQSATALARLASTLPALASERDGPVVVDIGRLHAHGAAQTAWLEAAAVALLVMRPTIESVAHTQSRLDSITALGTFTLVVCIGDCPHRVQEIDAALGNDVVSIAQHPRAGRLIDAGRLDDRWLRRSPTMRDIDGLAARLFAPSRSGTRS